MINWIISNTALFIAIVVGLALWVSLTTDYVKDYLPNVEPNIVCLGAGLIATLVAYFCGGAYLGIPFLWFEAIPCIMSCVFVSYIAQKGYDNLVKRYKDLMGQDEEPVEEEDDDDGIL